jgi:GH24 family phage-related lysozyme (muramidase)
MWKDLSMLERAALIKLGVDNGVYDVGKIKDSYNQYKDGGYKPSAAIKKRISNWEGSSMKTNRSFEEVARDFNASLPQGATSKLSQSQLDGLYSYSYNVGAGNFRKRVNPVLIKYLAGQATIQDVQRSMWASKDSQLRGLAKRRNAERAMLGDYTPMDFGPLSNTTTMMINQFLPSEEMEIPQLQFSEAFNNPSPVELEPSSTYNSSLEDIDFSEPSSSLANVLGMIQMIKSPRQINIHA